MFSLAIFNISTSMYTLLNASHYGGLMINLVYIHVCDLSLYYNARLYNVGYMLSAVIQTMCPYMNMHTYVPLVLLYHSNLFMHDCMVGCLFAIFSFLI